MFVHIFLFRWKAAATDAHRARAIAEIIDLRDRVPELCDVMVGNNVSLKADGFELAGVMTFADEADFDAYLTHPRTRHCCNGWCR